MRIVPRESIPDVTTMVQAGERLVEAEVVVDLSGRVKVTRLSDADGHPTLAKPRGRFAILSQPSASPPKRPPH